MYSQIEVCGDPKQDLSPHSRYNAANEECYKCLAKCLFVSVQVLMFFTLNSSHFSAVFGNSGGELEHPRFVIGGFINFEIFSHHLMEKVMRNLPSVSQYNKIFLEG